jgi:hypothetical protein
MSSTAEATAAAAAGYKSTHDDNCQLVGALARHRVAGRSRSAAEPWRGAAVSIFRAQAIVDAAAPPVTPSPPPTTTTTPTTTSGPS